jgi:glycosyltransferase involved in cell wall biosynthesis
MTETAIVVPCWNEAQRLDADAFLRFCEHHPAIRFFLVNDGSSDETLDMLRELERRAPESFFALDQQPNRGKAEAVRRGMSAAFERRPDYVGYWDADLATPLEEVPRFIEILEARPELEILFGSRVQLLGHSIERRAARHYLGRVFATITSLTLELAVYDTQCGAKLFRVTDEIQELFGEPFCTNWIFDVELVARLIRARRDSHDRGPENVICEVPLQRWRDVAGSKVGPLDFFRGIAELWRIRRRYLRRGEVESGDDHHQSRE